MSQPRLTLVGGPFDGATVGARSDLYVFVYGRRDAPRGSSVPRAGRAVYERRGDRLVDVSGQYRVCCGGIHHTAAECICGGLAAEPVGC